MYEFLVLGQLARRPMHGYLIARIIGDIMGPFRRVQWGALYPVLNRLMADDLIRAEEDDCSDGRSRKVYAITEAGGTRLHGLMMDTERHLADYEMMFALKVSLFFLLSPADRLYLCRHYSVYAQQNIDHLVRERDDLLRNEVIPREELAHILRVMDHGMERWRSERAWAEELIMQEHAKEAV